MNRSNISIALCLLATPAMPQSQGEIEYNTGTWSRSMDGSVEGELRCELDSLRDGTKRVYDFIQPKGGAGMVSEVSASFDGKTITHEQASRPVWLVGKHTVQGEKFFSLTYSVDDRFFLLTRDRFEESTEETDDASWGKFLLVEKQRNGDGKRIAAGACYLSQP